MQSSITNGEECRQDADEPRGHELAESKEGGKTGLEDFFSIAAR